MSHVYEAYGRTLPHDGLWGEQRRGSLTTELGAIAIELTKVKKGYNKTGKLTNLGGNEPPNVQS